MVLLLQSVVLLLICIIFGFNCISMTVVCGNEVGCGVGCDMTIIGLVTLWFEFVLERECDIVYISPSV